MTREGPVPLTEARRAEILAVNDQLSNQGLRVLAFGCRTLEAVRPLTLEDERGFTFLGLISMIDPPRPEAIQAVADAKRGGIRTIMITGDHKVTASAIARQLGIFGDGDLALSGVELGRHVRRGAGRGAGAGVGLCPGLAGAQDPHCPRLAAAGKDRLHDRRRRQRRPGPQAG